MQFLDTVSGLVISQKKEWGEIFTGFETKNKYIVLDSTGRELYMAIEEGGSTLSQRPRSVSSQRARRFTE